MQTAVKAMCVCEEKENMMFMEEGEKRSWHANVWKKIHLDMGHALDIERRKEEEEKKEKQKKKKRRKKILQRRERREKCWH